MPFNGAYRYRDWVIKAFNDDIPFDRFTVMQLAGDKLAYKTPDDRHANLTATTYLGAGPWVWDQAEPIQGRADERNERVDAVTRGLLGLTVGCARCHNHKLSASLPTPRIRSTRLHRQPPRLRMTRRILKTPSYMLICETTPPL
jgi:hypothetical protein